MLYKVNITSSHKVSHSLPISKRGMPRHKKSSVWEDISVIVLCVAGKSIWYIKKVSILSIQQYFHTPPMSATPRPGRSRRSGWEVVSIVFSCVAFRWAGLWVRLWWFIKASEGEHAARPPMLFVVCCVPIVPPWWKDRAGGKIKENRRKIRPGGSEVVERCEEKERENLVVWRERK